MPGIFRHCFTKIPLRSTLGAWIITLALAGSCSLSSPTIGHASLLGDRTGLGFESGLIKLQDGSWDYNNVDRFAGVFLEREIRQSWRLQLALRNGYVRSAVSVPGQEAGWTTQSTPDFSTLITQTMIGADYLFAANSPLTPTVGAGLGVTSWKVVDQSEGDPGFFSGGEAIGGFDLQGQSLPLTGDDLTLEFRLGARWRFTSRLEFHARAVYQVMQGNDRDNVGFSSIWGPDHVDANRAAGAGFVGLTWWFGQHDADGDGVPDDRDLCPDQPEDRDGFNDLDGCPDPDNDHDGIIDSLDGCPNMAEDIDGFEDQDGCPDRDNDGDGVPDGRDHCPETPPGTPVDQNGCAAKTNSR